MVHRNHNPAMISRQAWIRVVVVAIRRESELREKDLWTPSVGPIPSSMISLLFIVLQDILF